MKRILNCIEHVFVAFLGTVALLFRISYFLVYFQSFVSSDVFCVFSWTIQLKAEVCVIFSFSIYKVCISAEYDTHKLDSLNVGFDQKT